MRAIPRGSGNEDAVQSMFKQWAADRGLGWKEDAAIFMGCAGGRDSLITLIAFLLGFRPCERAVTLY